MRHTATALLVLALATPALAGQNPHIAIYLYTNAAGIGGTNHNPSPAPGASATVYVCFDYFNPGGGILGAEWAFIETGGPLYLSTTNLYAGVGGLTLGVPGVPPGCSMTVGPDPAYPASYTGIIVLASVLYGTPGEVPGRGGTIEIVPYGGTSRAVLDANGAVDAWCVHSMAYNGMSGNWGWDASPIPDGDCYWWTPVEQGSWGCIKALYR